MVWNQYLMLLEKLYCSVFGGLIISGCSVFTFWTPSDQSPSCKAASDRGKQADRGRQPERPRIAFCLGFYVPLPASFLYICLHHLLSFSLPLCLSFCLTCHMFPLHFVFLSDSPLLFASVADCLYLTVSDILFISVSVLFCFCLCLFCLCIESIHGIVAMALSFTLHLPLACLLLTLSDCLTFSVCLVSSLLYLCPVHLFLPLCPHPLASGLNFAAVSHSCFCPLCPSVQTLILN